MGPWSHSGAALQVHGRQRYLPAPYRRRAGSGTTDTKAGVVALGARARVVGVGEHGDTRRLDRGRLTEQSRVVLQRVDTLVDPLVTVGGCSGAQHHDLREP